MTVPTAVARVRRAASCWRLATACALALAVLATAPAAHAVAIQRVVADGIEAWLVEDHRNPIVAVELAFRGGAGLDPAGREGLANLAMALLDEGAGERDATAFQSLLEDHSIELRFDAERDSLRASLRTLSQHRELAFAALGDALGRPRFDADALVRVRGQMQAWLRRQSEDPDTVADRALFARLFPDHPYGRPVEGTAESLDAITADDLRAFAARRLHRRNLIIGVVGDIDAAELARLVGISLGALPADGDNAALQPPPPRRGALAVVDMAIPQSTVAFAQPGLARADADYYAFSVVNQVLGGAGLTSRLFAEVRDKRGLAYAVSTRPHLLDGAPLLLGRAATANERVADTVAIIRDEWARMAEKGLDAEELAAAKAYLTGSFPLRLTSSPRIAGMLVAIQREGLGIDYLDRYAGYIEGVTLSDANRVARRVLDPSALTFVIVGQPVGLSPQH